LFQASKRCAWLPRARRGNGIMIQLAYGRRIIAAAEKKQKR
jgi:hypothetical protein